MIPLILAATAAVGSTGLFFMKKGVDSEKIFSDAKKLDEDTKNLLEKIQTYFDEIQTKTRESLKNLIKMKTDILNVDIKIFLENFSKIKKIKYDEINFSREDLIELQFESNNAKNLDIDKIFENLGEVSYSLYEVDTETNLPKWIESITDPEKENNKSFLSSFLSANKKSAKVHRAFNRKRTTSDAQALLIAGAIGLLAKGTIKFTGHAAKGYYLNDKSNKALENANENFNSVKSFEEQVKKSSVILNDIYNLSEKISETLLHLDENFSDEIEKLENIIFKFGRHWDKYLDEDKKIVEKNVCIAKNIKDTLLSIDSEFEKIYLKIDNENIK